MSVGPVRNVADRSSRTQHFHDGSVETTVPPSVVTVPDAKDPGFSTSRSKQGWVLRTHQGANAGAADLGIAAVDGDDVNAVVAVAAVDCAHAFASDRGTAVS